ncbi:MAG: hypothetical protein ACLQDM_12075 [Bradyrhizobium sp.]
MGHHGAAFLGASPTGADLVPFGFPVGLASGDRTTISPRESFLLSGRAWRRRHDETAAIVTHHHVELFACANRNRLRKGVQHLRPPAIGLGIRVIGKRDTVRKVDAHPLDDADCAPVLGHLDRHFVEMADRHFQVAHFCDDPRQQQKNVGLAMAMVQQSQIALFGFFEISAGMKSCRALQELEEDVRSVAMALIGRRVPSFARVPPI